MRSSRGRRRCSTRCCRGWRSISTPAPPDLRALFDGADEVRLESGFGGGEHLVAEAERNPKTGFIGIEPFVNGMAKALAAIDDRGLANIRLHHGDATDVLAWLPDASLARFDLLYPDPWPKRRHWKRRFVQDGKHRADRPHRAAGRRIPLRDRLARLRRMDAAAPRARADFEWTAERADDWRLPWPGFTSTRYEAKAKREGRVPCYLIFRRR